MEVQKRTETFKLMVVVDGLTGFTEDEFMVCTICGTVFLCRKNAQTEDKEAHGALHQKSMK